MEEPLIIRRDEQMFRMGFIAFAISLPAFILLISVAGKSPTNIWDCELSDMRMWDIAVDLLLLIACLVVFTGVMAVVQSYQSRYKLDENGIMEKYIVRYVL